MILHLIFKYPQGMQTHILSYIFMASYFNSDLWFPALCTYPLWVIKQAQLQTQLRFHSEAGAYYLQT